MIKTYIRPWWKSFLIFLGFTAGTEAVMTIMSYFLVPALTGSENAFKLQESILGPIPFWTALPIAFVVASPLFGILMFFASAPKVYSRELKKGLFPVFEGTNQMQAYPHKAKNSERKMVHPEWVESLPEFKGTLIYTGNWPGEVYGVEMMQDETTHRVYMLTNHDFRKIVSEMKDGKTTGTWIPVRLSYKYFGIEPKNEKI